MNSTILDLDTPLSYASKFEQILYAEDTWSVLLSDFNGTCEIYQEFHNRPVDVKNPFVKNLRNQCEEVLRKDYTHVAVYHACRTTNPDEYRRLGLLTSSRERLQAKAKEIFTGIKGLDSALLKAEGYFLMYDESVSMYISAILASTEYLTGGSHYLRMVAANLGSEAKERLIRENSKGRPVFVKCAIPLSWLEDRSIVKEQPWLYLYSTTLIKRLIWARANSLENYQEPPEALVIFRAIPPENIESILEADIKQRKIKGSALENRK